MRAACALVALALVAGCVAVVGDERGVRTTAVISPIGIAVVPVYAPQPAPGVPAARPAPAGRLRP